MRICIDPRRPLPWVRLAPVVVIALFLSGWTTCSVMGALNTCQSVTPRVTALSPSTMSADTQSALLTVTGTNFTPQSQILWNGSPLPTTFVDSGTLQTTVTQHTFSSFGGASGSTVQISAMTMGSATSGCSNAGSTVTLVLEID